MKYADNRHSIDFVFVLLVFAAFMMTATLLVSLGTGEYKNITASMQQNDTVRLPSAYLTQKVRQCRTEDAVHVTELEGTPALTLRQEIADLPGSSILKHMILRTDADILFRAVFSVSIAFLRIIAFNQSQRYFPLIQEAQQLLRIPIVHMNINSRVRPDIGRERGNDRIFADGHGHPDRNQRVYVRLFPKLIPDDFFILFHGVQSGIKNSSLLCQGQHLLLIAEKLYPIVVFKIMDLLCHGRLGEIKLCGGFCKIHCMADSQKACYAEIKHVYSSIESYIGIIVLSGDRVGTDKTIKIIY